MEKLLVLVPFLKSLKLGHPYRKVFAFLLRIMALASIAGALFADFKIWSLVEEMGGMGAANLVFVVLVLFLFQLFAYVWLTVLWFHAGTIDVQEAVEDFSVTPVVGELVKVAGELMASVLAFLGLLFFVGSFFQEAQDFMSLVSTLFPRFPFKPAAGPLSSLVVLAVFWSLGFAVLTATQFLSEVLSAVVAIARNTSGENKKWTAPPRRKRQIRKRRLGSFEPSKRSR